MCRKVKPIRGDFPPLHFLSSRERERLVLVVYLFFLFTKKSKMGFQNIAKESDFTTKALCIKLTKITMGGRKTKKHKPHS